MPAYALKFYSLSEKRLSKKRMLVKIMPQLTIFHFSLFIFHFQSTRGGSRTRTSLRTLDFESSASTNSATLAILYSLPLC
jgi:hypothetical protein